MSELKSLVETLRLSLYETIAILIPGLALIVTLRAYLPFIVVPGISDLPIWIVYVVSALVAGYATKGFVSQLADEYTYRFKPWFENFFPLTEGSSVPERPSWKGLNKWFVSRRRLPWYIAPPVLRVLTEPLLAGFLAVYIPWREIRVGNRIYFASAEYKRIKSRLEELCGLKPEEIGEHGYWSLCYGALPKEDLQDRDRLDALSDMLRGMIVVVMISAALLAWHAPHDGRLILWLLLHLLVAYSLYNRVLRYTTLATRNMFRAFFHRHCRTPSSA